MQEYFVKPSIEGLRILENREGLSWSAYLGIAGMPGAPCATDSDVLILTHVAGQTVYYGWNEYSSAKSGETLFVSAAAGMS